MASFPIIPKKARVLFGRGLRLRCPACGEGKLYRRWFRMYQHCLDCGFIYAREPGYFTAAVALNVFFTNTAKMDELKAYMQSNTKWARGTVKTLRQLREIRQELLKRLGKEDDLDRWPAR